MICIVGSLGLWARCFPNTIPRDDTKNKRIIAPKLFFILFFVFFVQYFFQKKQKKNKREENFNIKTNLEVGDVTRKEGSTELPGTTDPQGRSRGVVVGATGTWTSLTVTVGFPLDDEVDMPASEVDRRVGSGSWSSRRRRHVSVSSPGCPTVSAPRCILGVPHPNPIFVSVCMISGSEARLNVVLPKDGDRGPHHFEVEFSTFTPCDRPPGLGQEKKNFFSSLVSRTCGV